MVVGKEARSGSGEAPASLPHKSPNPCMPACRHVPAASPPWAPGMHCLGSTLNLLVNGGGRGGSGPSSSRSSHDPVSLLIS